MLLSAVGFLVLNYEGPTREPCVLCAQVASVVSDSFATRTLWAVARQSSLSMRFSRQEYCSGLPCPPSGDLPGPRDQTHISYVSCICGWVLYL